MPWEQEWADRAKQVIQANSDATLSTLRSVDANFLAVAKAFVEARGKILVTGSGTSGAIANRAAHVLSVAGTPAFYLPPSDGLHGGLGVLQPQDWVLALSRGGCSNELNDFCAHARTLCAGLVSITGDGCSPLARLSTYVITLNLPFHSDLGAVLATGSSFAAAAVTDALAEVCRIGRCYDWERVLFTHPAGAVGRDAEQSLQRLRAVGG